MDIIWIQYKYGYVTPVYLNSLDSWSLGVLASTPNGFSPFHLPPSSILSSWYIFFRGMRITHTHTSCRFTQAQGGGKYVLLQPNQPNQCLPSPTSLMASICTVYLAGRFPLAKSVSESPWLRVFEGPLNQLIIHDP